MILAGVVGAPGSGKTQLLARLAADLARRGERVDGFLAIAGDRPLPDRGAESYELMLVRTGEAYPYARRDLQATPPYRFDPEVDAMLDAWAAQLSRPEILILDTFGPREATGGGHLRLWPALRDSGASVLIVATRTEVISELESRLGRRFDLILDAQDPESEARLERLTRKPRDWDRIAKYGGGSGAVEMTLGSALHGARIPLRGQVLSTLQAMLLTSAGEGLERKDRLGWVGVIAAGLKALSPAGNRLRPMVAISSQAVLYSLVVRGMGWTAASAFVAGFLIGIWATAQGVVLQYLLVGDSLLTAYDAVVRWLARALGLGSPGLPAVLAVVVLLSGLLTGGVCLAFWRRRHSGLARLTAVAERMRPVRRRPTTRREAILGALRDLAHPGFWLPIALVVAILAFNGTSQYELLWIFIRALTVALLLFALARSVGVERLADWLRRRGHDGPAIALRRALAGRSDSDAP